MGDGGVGQHPLDVALGHRQHRADEHAEDRDDPHHRLPAPPVRAEGDVEEPHDRAERRRLGRGRHERRDGGRGALVDVRRPGLERRRADLEEQADGQHPEADEHQRLVGRVVADRLVDVAEVHRPGEAVGERDAVEEEGGGERAEHEVLERGLLAEQPAAAGQAAEEVQRQREHLEGHEHGDQVAGGREQHHAEDGEQQQRVDLGVVEAGGLALGLGAGECGGLTGERRDPALDLALGEQQAATQGEQQDQAPEEHARPVDHDGAHRADDAAGAVRALAVLLQLVGDRDRRGHGEHDAADGQRRLDQEPVLAGHERLDQHAEAGHGEDDEQRREVAVLDRGLGELVHQWEASSPTTVGLGSCTPTLSRMVVVAGLITSSSGIG